MEIDNLLAASHEAVPPLEWFDNVPTEGVMTAARLEGVALDTLGHPTVGDGERELGRWIGLGACMVMVTDDGSPVAATSAMRGELVPAVSGGGLSLLLTERRLVGSFLTGQLGGSVPIRDGQALALSYPFELIDAVAVTVTRSVFGKLRDRAITVHTLQAPAVGVVNFEPDASLQYPSLQGQRNVAVGAVAESLVAAIARHRKVPAPDFEQEDGQRVASFPERHPEGNLD